MSAEAVAAETPEGLPLPAPNAAEPLSMGAVLRIAPLRRLWYAQVVSVFGDFLALYAVMTIVTAMGPPMMRMMNITCCMRALADRRP